MDSNRRHPETDNLTPQIRLGKALRNIRESLGMSVYEVARRMGKKPSAGTQVARWERGQVALSADRLWAYLNALDASFADLDHELNPAPVTSSRLEEIADQLQALP